MAEDPTAPPVPAYEIAGWPTRRLKLDIHDGITVEIRRGRPEIVIYQGGRLCADHEAVAASVAELMGSLRPLASVAVFLGGDRWTHPTRIADAIWFTDSRGGDRPHAVPGDAQLIELPFSEVCMHMRLAGRLRWVAPVEHGMAQLYDVHGRPFSAPILRSEAGLDDRTDQT